MRAGASSQAACGVGTGQRRTCAKACLDFSLCVAHRACPPAWRPELQDESPPWSGSFAARLTAAQRRRSRRTFHYVRDGTAGRTRVPDLLLRLPQTDKIASTGCCLRHRCRSDDIARWRRRCPCGEIGPPLRQLVIKSSGASLLWIHGRPHFCRRRCGPPAARAGPPSTRPTESQPEERTPVQASPLSVRRTDVILESEGARDCATL